MTFQKDLLDPEHTLSADNVDVEPDTGITVLVVGAGVGGLMTALECARNGHRVRVIERSPTPSTQGDFFTVGSNIIRHFHHHWPALAARSEQINYPALLAYYTIAGKQISAPAPASLKELEVTAKDGTEKTIPLNRHHRPKFVAALLAQVKGMGIAVTFGTKVVDYFEDVGRKRAGVVLESGERLEAHLVVAADGIGTKSHRLITGHDDRAWSSGFSILRTCFPVEPAISDPDIKQRWPLSEDGESIIEIWAGNSITFFVQRYTDLFSWLIMYKSEGGGMESWSRTVHVSKALELTSKIPGFPEIASRLMKTTPPDNLVDWALMWRNPRENWVSPGGLVLQVGDSAHTFLPSSGNGATQAMEDAISIAACLRLGGIDNLALAAKTHNALRFERVSCIQLYGFINHQIQNNSGFKVIGDNKAPFKVKMGAWITTHDPHKYACDNFAACRDAVLAGAPFKATNTPPGYSYKPWTFQDIFARIEEGNELYFEGDWS